MRRHPITVLKFGSSVLRKEEDLAHAVHEIYRWVRQGQRVVAVVSAIGSSTNQLLAQSQAYGDRINEHAVAALVSTGEAQSSALLALALDRAGVPASIFDESRLGLRAEGSVLDSEPISLDADAIFRSLEKHAVAVVPGFVGRQNDGSICLLGRGGSDLTAVFVAQQLGAERCRLIKDVDGVFESDPALGKYPRRYRFIHFAEARKIAGRLVQAKAIDYAAHHHLPIEVATLGSTSPTTINDSAPVFYTDRTDLPQVRVGLLGAGTVGLGVYRRLSEIPDYFDVVKVAVRNVVRHRDIPRELLTDDPWQVVESDCDLVIELIGGLSPAAELIEAALRSGKHVITANKLVIAHKGQELRRIAAEKGVALLYSAAVGGAVPMLEEVSRLALDAPIHRVQGVINGTTNFVLDRIAEGFDPDEALREAQRLGFAEQDPSSDLDGRDAAHKLSLLAHTAFGTWIEPGEIERTGIESIDVEFIRDATASGRVVRLVGEVERYADGIRARVAPAAIDAGDALANTRNEENCLVVHSAFGELLQVHGKGAGRWPTTEAVIGDIFELHRSGKLLPAPVSSAERRIS